MLLRASLLLLALGSFAACGKGPGGKLAVDSPALPYQAPDIDEITGIDPDAEPAPAEPPKEGTAPAPAPAPTPKK